LVYAVYPRIPPQYTTGCSSSTGVSVRRKLVKFSPRKLSKRKSGAERKEAIDSSKRSDSVTPPVVQSGEQMAVDTPFHVGVESVEESSDDSGAVDLPLSIFCLSIFTQIINKKCLKITKSN